MHHRRRILMLALLGLVALLAVVLFTSVRPSNMFRIATPPVKPQPTLKDTISSTVAGPLGDVSGTTLLEKPRYTGQDATGRGWTVEAENALQGGSATSATYILQEVTAAWHDPSQTTPLQLTATEGHYNQAAATIRLTGNVRATGMGLAVTAPVVDADLTTRFISASGGTQVTGLLGRAGSGWNTTINAPVLSANPNTNTLLFTGGVRARLVPLKE